MTATALYARVSSDKQAQEGTIESQIQSLHEHANAQGLDIDADLSFIDNGISGASLSRPALDALRDKAAKGEISKVLVLSPDRLARKYVHQLLLVEEFQKLGVEIVFANRNIAATPEDQLLLQMQGVIAEYEREKIMERGRRGKLHKAKNGSVAVMCQAPFGYVYIHVARGQDARFEIHPEEAEIVRRIFKMAALERIPLSHIARRLTSEKVPTRKKVGHWNRAVIWSILKNTAYIGKAAWRKRESVPSKRPTRRTHGRTPLRLNGMKMRPQSEWIYIPVPAIVPESLFARAQVLMDANKRLSPRNNKKYPYLLNGLLRCQECGYALYGKVASNSRYKRCYYRCTGTDGHRFPDGRRCSSYPVRVEVLDDLVWDQVKTLIERPDVVLKEYESRAGRKQRATSSFDTIIATKKREIRARESEKERLLDLYQAGTIDLKEIELRLASLRAKLNRLADECVLLEREKTAGQKQLQLIARYEDFLRKIGENLGDLDFAKRKEVVRNLVEDVIVDLKNETVFVRHIIPVDTSCQLRQERRQIAQRNAAAFFRILRMGPEQRPEQCVEGPIGQVALHLRHQNTVIYGRKIASHVQLDHITIAAQVFQPLPQG